MSETIQNTSIPTKTFNYPVCFLRLFATFCVLGLHSIQSTGGNPDYFPWFCGVPLFFIISGYLFGQGQINNVMEWYKKRLIRVWLPFVLLVIINCVILVSNNRHISMITLLKTVLLFPSETSNYALGVGHCWYVSYIIIAYAITPLLHKLFDSSYKKIFVLLSFVFTVVVCQLTAYTPFFGKLSFVHFILYITAFAIGKILKEYDTKRSSVVAIVLGLTICFLTKFGMSYSVSSTYRSFLYLIGTYFISLTFFGIVIMVLVNVNWNRTLSSGVQLILKKIDHNSYYAYLVHIWFVQWGFWSVFEKSSLVLIYAEYISLIFISTIIFSIIAEKIIHIVSRYSLPK